MIKYRYEAEVKGNMEKFSGQPTWDNMAKKVFVEDCPFTKGISKS